MANGVVFGGDGAYSWGRFGGEDFALVRRGFWAFMAYFGVNRLFVAGLRYSNND